MHESQRITTSHLPWRISQITTQSEVIVLSFTSVLSPPFLASAFTNLQFISSWKVSKKRNLIIELVKVWDHIAMHVNDSVVSWPFRLISGFLLKKHVPNVLSFNKCKLVLKWNTAKTPDKVTKRTDVVIIRVIIVVYVFHHCYIKNLLKVYTEMENFFQS